MPTEKSHPHNSGDPRGGPFSGTEESSQSSSLNRERHFVLPNGERRLNVVAPEVKATLAYIDRSLDQFTVRANEANRPLVSNPIMQRLGVGELGKGTDEDKQVLERVREVLLADDVIRRTESEEVYYLPNDYVAPTDKNSGFFKTQFYWDSAWHIRWLLDSDEPDKLQTAKGTVENCKYMFDRKGFIPNASASKYGNRSQPPLLTTMITDVFEGMRVEEGETEDNKEWYRSMMSFAKDEYWKVWNNDNDLTQVVPRKGNRNHRIERTMLGKYGDTDIGYDINAELESGWDMTHRFHGRCADFLPVDLNCYLAKYEKHFEDAAHYFGDEAEAKFWKDRRKQRTDEIMDKMLDKERGFFYDYDWVNGERSEVDSLSGFMPLWAGIIDDDDLKRRMIEKLSKDFMQPHGITLTTEDAIPQHPSDADMEGVKFKKGIKRTLVKYHKPKQWNFPNQFANVADQVVEAAISNGFYDVGIEIMTRFIDSHTDYFLQKGSLPEKLNVVTGQEGNGAAYGDQTEIGLTLAVYKRFVKNLPKLYAIKDRASEGLSVKEQERVVFNAQLQTPLPL